MPPSISSDRGETSVSLVLPFPPTVNNLFMNISGRGRVRSPAYRKWREEAGWMIAEQRPGKVVGPVSLSIRLVAPDKRRRDADNCLKPIIDVLTTMSIIEADDNRIVLRIEAEWAEAGEPCTVTVKGII